MKRVIIISHFLFFFVSLQSLHAQKSETRNNGFSMGLSYRVYEFYTEDYAIAPDLLTDGKWADGLLGLNVGYLARFNKTIGISTDYRFLIGTFDRGFEYYAHAINPPDVAMGHQIFVGPTLNIGKGKINISLKVQGGYDLLKIEGKGDENYTVTARSNIIYVGSAPGWWLNWLNSQNQEKQVEVSHEGYPTYKRKGFLYQLGTNFNITGEIATFTMYANYCPTKYNGIIHQEFDIGIGTILHF